MANNEDIIRNALIRFDLDFFTHSSRREIAKKIAKYVGVDTIYTNKYIHDEIKGRRFRVCRNDFGGEKMVQIQTCYLPYYEAINISFKLFDIIGEFGYTTNKCCATITIKSSDENIKIHDINKLKLIIGVDSCNSRVLRKTMREDDYANSLNYIYPINVMTCRDDINDFINFNDFNYPKSSKFDIDFENIKNDYVSVRYREKEGYEKEKRNFKIFVDGLLSSIYNAIRSNSYTEDEMVKIRSVIKNQRNLLKSIWTYDDLAKTYPKLEVMIDMKKDRETVSFYYNKMRDKIFNLMCYGKMTSGAINYDTELNEFQVSEAILINSQYIEGVSFYYSSLSGTFTNCIFNECNIKNSKLDSCEIMYGTEIEDSRIYNTKFHGIEIYIEDSFIKNPDELFIEANIINCIVDGKLEYHSMMDERSEILN